MGASLPPVTVDTSAYVRAADLPASVSQLAPVTSVNGRTGAVTTATIPGFFTVQNATAPLPDPVANAGRYANVGDLGGVAADGAPGTGLVYSNGACWSRFRAQAATVQVIPLAGAVSLSALKMSSTVQLSGTNLMTSTKINITGACQGDVFHVIFPAGLLGALGSLGVSLNGGTALSVPALAGAASGTWADYAVNGTGVVKIAGGPL